MNMICERPKNRVWTAILPHRGVKPLVETRDRAPDRVRRPLCAVARTPAVLALKFDDGFEFAEGFGFHGFGFIFGIEGVFASFLFPLSGAHGLGCVEADAG